MGRRSFYSDKAANRSGKSILAMPAQKHAPDLLVAILNRLGKE